MFEVSESVSGDKMKEIFPLPLYQIYLGQVLKKANSTSVVDHDAEEEERVQ
jgi:hypothetical protein